MATKAWLVWTAVSAAAAAGTLVSPKDIKVDDSASVLGVAKTLATGVMSYYNGTAEQFQDLPSPYYWWECGALFGAMLDYSHFTQDSTYDEIIATALMAQTGPNYDYMLPKHYGDEGNDDQAFWGFSVLSAAERDFAQPAALTPEGMPSWLQLGENIWNSMVVRWNTTACGGGFLWQIFADNYNGLTYKNAVANGGFFQLSARLARLTGNQTYVDWATRVWDWSTAIGMVDASYNVFDGASVTDNCSAINQLSFSYDVGIYLYGAAVMANHTGDAAWTERARGLLGAAAAFFSPYSNSTDVMWEHACEGVGTCNTDMKSFKGYLSRFLYASAAVLPGALADTVASYMQASAAAAGAACSGSAVDNAPSPDGATCGEKWYVGGFDGSVGLGQQMSALETIQGLLSLQPVLDTLSGKTSSTTTTSASATATPTQTQSSSASSTASARPSTCKMRRRKVRAARA